MATNIVMKDYCCAGLAPQEQPCLQASLWQWLADARSCQVGDGDNPVATPTQRRLQSCGHRRGSQPGESDAGALPSRACIS